MLDKFIPPKRRIKTPPKIEEAEEVGALDWIEKNIWKKAKKAVGHIPFTTDLFAACYCIADTSGAVPAKARLAFAGAAIYFIVPTDAVPDFLPFIGYGDDAVGLTAAIAALGAYMQDSHYARAREKMNELGLREGRRSGLTPTPHRALSAANYQSVRVFRRLYNARRSSHCSLARLARRRPFYECCLKGRFSHAPISPSHRPALLP